MQKQLRTSLVEDGDASKTTVTEGEAVELTEVSVNEEDQDQDETI